MSRPLHKVTSAFTVTDAYSGYDICASGGYLPLTLADPAGYDDTVEVTVINGSSTSGIRLIGFPADVKPILYPRQSVGVRVVDSAWVSTGKPGRYASASGVIVHVDPTNGDDSFDGLTPANPVRTPGRAIYVLHADIDTQYVKCAVALKAGETFTAPFNFSGQAVGGNLLWLEVYGTGTATVVTSGPAINVGDNAELYIKPPAGTALVLKGNQSDAAESGSIYLHNNGLFDMDGDVTIWGNGPKSSAIYFDGPTAGASFVGCKLAGRFRSFFRMDQGGGRYTIGGVIDGVLDGAGQYPVIDHMIEVSNGEALLGCSFGTHWGSVGPSQVSCNGVVVTNGVSVPGGWNAADTGGIIATSKFPYGDAAPGTPAVLTGTASGDFTAGAGNAAAFNGVTSGTSAIAAKKSAAASGAISYLQLDFGSAKALTKVKVYPANDMGYIPAAINIDLSFDAWIAGAWVNVANLTGQPANTGAPYTITGAATGATKARIGFKHNSGSAKDVYCVEAEFHGS